MLSYMYSTGFTGYMSTVSSSWPKSYALPKGRLRYRSSTSAAGIYVAWIWRSDSWPSRVGIKSSAYSTCIGLLQYVNRSRPRSYPTCTYRYHGAKWIIASMTRVSSVMFGFPPCHKRRSRMMIEPFFTVGCEGGLIALRSSTRSFLIRPLALSPCCPTWHSRFEPIWLPSQISVLPFSAVMSTRGTFKTNANGQSGCLMSASEWVGWDWGGESALGERAVFPETNDSLGLGPRTADVTCIAMRLRKILGSKCSWVRGGSCWIFLIAARSVLHPDPCWILTLCCSCRACSLLSISRKEHPGPSFCWVCPIWTFRSHSLGPRDRPYAKLELRFRDYSMSAFLLKPPLARFGRQLVLKRVSPSSLKRVSACEGEIQNLINI